MSDLERYGDYTEYEDDIPKRKNRVLLVLKLLIAAVCIGVVGILVFRVILFNQYPDSIENVYFDEVLTEYYNKTEGNINAKTQSLRAAYDDADEGNFFCDNLIVISGANQLQISARFNVSLMESIKEKYGVELNPDDDNIFTFRLAKNPSAEGEQPTEIGRLSVSFTESRMMYRYYKLVFNDVDFGLDEGESPVYWIRLEIFINGVEMEEPYMVAIYENNESYNRFEDLGKSK